MKSISRWFKHKTTYNKREVGKQEGRKLSVRKQVIQVSKAWQKPVVYETTWEVIYYSKEEGKVVYKRFEVEEEALKHFEEVKKSGYKSTCNRPSYLQFCREEDSSGRVHGSWSTKTSDECPKCKDYNELYDL